MTVWIGSKLAFAIHSLQLSEHGGDDGVRDANLLESALARPHNIAAYEPDHDLARLAAAYGCTMIKNHPFIDGNKRTGYVVMETFIILNGQSLAATEEEKYPIVMAVADGTMSEEELARWLRERLVGSQVPAVTK
ncbi:MAG: type II toxin-antitoxin system death-on-curing family toxin [Acidobacteriota bacterium]